MIVPAVATGTAILAWAGLAAGVATLIVVVGLFNRVVRPAAEIDRYASDILEAGVGIARNVDAVDELERTRELGAAAPGLAGTYLERLGGTRP